MRLQQGKATRTSSPCDAGIHELSASDVHSPHVTMRLVSSCLTFSPLPPAFSVRPGPERPGWREGQGAVVFFCTDLPLRTTSRKEADCSALPGLSSCITIECTRQAVRPVLCGCKITASPTTDKRKAAFSVCKCRIMRARVAFFGLQRSYLNSFPYVCRANRPAASLHAGRSRIFGPMSVAGNHT